MCLFESNKNPLNGSVQMKRVYFILKMNSQHYVYFMDVEATNAKDACKAVKIEIKRRINRNAFDCFCTPTKAVVWDKEKHPRPWTTDEWKAMVMEKAVEFNKAYKSWLHIEP